MVTIDKNKCVECGTCLAVCPPLAIEKKNGRHVFAHKSSCLRCWHCVAVCPHGAVQCDEFPLESFEKLKKLSPKSFDVAKNILLNRRSVREFEKEEVPRELLEELLALGASAPTAANTQLVKLNVVTTRKVLDQVDDKVVAALYKMTALIDNPVATGLIGMLAGEKLKERYTGRKSDIDRAMAVGGEKGKSLFRAAPDAPVLIVAHTGIQAITGKQDSFIALSHIMFAAVAAGLGATWLGYLAMASQVDPSIKKVIGVPFKNTIHAAILLGWPKYTYQRSIPRSAGGVKWIEE